MSSARHLLLYILVAVGACAPTEEPGTPEAVLAEGRTLQIDAATSRATLHAAVRVGDHELALLDDTPVQGGRILAMLHDDDLGLDEVTLTHTEFRLPLDGTWIASIELRTAGPLTFHDVSWSDDGLLASTPDAVGLVTVAFQLVAPGLRNVELERVTTLHAGALVLATDDRVDLMVSGETDPMTWEWGPFTFTATLDLAIDTYVAVE
jgi:hypothetical protein